MAATRSSSISTSALAVSVAVTTVPLLMRVLMRSSSFPDVPPASSDGGPRPANRGPTGAQYPPHVSTSDWHVAQVNIALLPASIRRSSRTSSRCSSRSTPSRTGARASCGGCRPRPATPPGSAHQQQQDHREPVGVGDDRGPRAVRLRLPAQRGPSAPARLVRTDGQGPPDRIGGSPAGTTPAIEEAERRLATLRERGPSSDAFTLREPFPAPGSNVPVPTQDGWRYPTTQLPA